MTRAPNASLTLTAASLAKRLRASRHAVQALADRECIATIIDTMIIEIDRLNIALRDAKKDGMRAAADIADKACQEGEGYYASTRIRQAADELDAK